MRVVIPTYPGSSNVAELVLDAEGIAFEIRRCDGPYGYGQLVTELWASGKGFILVEHDVAPWFGALRQLMGCTRDWCMFHYPEMGGSLTRGLGCTKFSTRLVASYPDLSRGWAATDWGVLDGSVGAAVAETLKAEQPGVHPLCYHDPPVAHARRPEG